MRARHSSDRIARSTSRSAVRRRGCRVTTAALLVAVIAGGGSGAAKTASSSSSSARTTSTTTVSTSSAPAGDTTIRMVPPGRYSPSELRIKAGSTVTWQDTGTPEKHNVVFITQKGQTTEDPRAPSHREQIPTNTTYAALFATPGEYNYICTFHVNEGMFGSLTVV
jgi:plastocyanin